MNKFQIANIKRAAQTINPLMNKLSKLEEKKAELDDKIEDIKMQIEMWDAPIKQLSGGFSTMDLVNKVIKDGGFDKTGKVIKVTTFELKYPDTIIPAVEKPSISVLENNEEVMEEVINELEKEETI